MGAGKTSVGRPLAHRLGLPFHDSDDAVARAAGLATATLFRTRGELAFRVLERTAIGHLLAGERAVIATGGGAVIDPGTRSALRERAFTIWLDAAPVVLARRLAGSQDRPLLGQGDPVTILTGLLEQRRPFLAAAQLRIATDTLRLDEVVERIVEEVG